MRAYVTRWLLISFDTIDIYIYIVSEKMYKDMHQMKYFIESTYKDLSFSVIGGV